MRLMLYTTADNNDIINNAITMININSIKLIWGQHAEE